MFRPKAVAFGPGQHGSPKPVDRGDALSPAIVTDAESRSVAGVLRPTLPPAVGQAGAVLIPLGVIVPWGFAAFPGAP